MPRQKTLTPAERVAVGAAWLDTNYPGWVASIDLDQLRLASSCNCILGQQFGDFWYAPLPATKESFQDTAYAMGFNVDWKHGSYEDNHALEAEWRALIAARTAVPA